MYVSIARHVKETIEVNYRDDSKLFSFSFGTAGNLILNQDEMEHLYNEMGSALMHRHYSQKTKEVESEWEN
jgi:hypothetical protein